MASLYTPSEKGFDQRLEAIDRCQVGLLRELAGQLGNRLILKGGMAMRVAFGSVRLTKGIDFDRDDTISQATLKKGLEKLLVRAAGTAGIREPKAVITKDTKTTVRARLHGFIGENADVRFDVEVSGRAAPAKENVRVEVVVPPPRYSMAPFPVTTYTNETLAAMKMTANWKGDAERLLMQPDSPSVMTTAMLHALLTTGRPDAPSPATFTRWVATMATVGKLREVIKGVYLNCLGHRDVSPAAAAHWVRNRSVVSLSWVLEQAHITNNFGDTITCVIPTAPSWPNPQIGDRVTAAGTFRFFAMPAHLVDERAGRLEDIRDLRFNYPRTTPEKALLDWIFLGASPRSRMTRPPFDLEVAALNMPRLRRIAKSMRIVPLMEEWFRQFDQYEADEDVRENAATRMRF